MSREDVLEQWRYLHNAILYADSGDSNVVYREREDDKVKGLFMEIDLSFNELLSPGFDTNDDAAIKAARGKMAGDIESGVFSGKQRLLIDWMSARNAILRADGAEMKVNYHKNEFAGGGIFGVTAELELIFSEPTSLDFTENEISTINVAKNK